MEVQVAAHGAARHEFGLPQFGARKARHGQGKQAGHYWTRIDLMLLHSVPQCTGLRTTNATNLNASVSTVQEWVSGETKPSGAALRLLSVIDRKGLEVLA